MRSRCSRSSPPRGSHYIHQRVAQHEQSVDVLHLAIETPDDDQARLIDRVAQALDLLGVAGSEALRVAGAVGDLRGYRLVKPVEDAEDHDHRDARDDRVRRTRPRLYSSWAG